MLGRVGDQAEHGEADEELLRRGPRAQAEDGPERVALRTRQPREPVEQRDAQLMQARVGQFHLGLDPDGAHQGHVRRRGDQVLQQRRLPDPGLAPQDQRAALSAADVADQSVQHGALARPPEEVHADRFSDELHACWCTEQPFQERPRVASGSEARACTRGSGHLS